MKNEESERVGSYMIDDMEFNATANDASLGGLTLVHYGTTIPFTDEFYSENIPEVGNKQVWLNKSFWKKPQKGKRPTSSSCRNLAKKLQVGEENFAMLIQALAPLHNSSTHYHTEPEYITQIAGKSIILSFPRREIEDYRLFEMEPGQILRLAPDTLHNLISQEEGSITLPAKKTFIRRGDHYYPNEDEKAHINEKVRSVMGLLTD